MYTTLQDVAPMINTDIQVWKSESTAKQSGTNSLDCTAQGQTDVMTTRFSKSLEKEAMPCRLETSGKSWRAEEEFDLAMSVWVGIRYLEKGGPVLLSCFRVLTQSGRASHSAFFHICIVWYFKVFSKCSQAPLCVCLCFSGLHYL